MIPFPLHGKCNSYFPLQGCFPGAATVNVSVINLADDSSVSLTAGTATRIGSTDYFKWFSSDIVTQPTVETDLWIQFAADTGETSDYTVKLGGVADAVYDIITALSSMPDIEAIEGVVNSAVTGLATSEQVGALATAEQVGNLNNLSASDVGTALTNFGAATMNGVESLIGDLNDLSSLEMAALITDGLTAYPVAKPDDVSGDTYYI